MRFIERLELDDEMNKCVLKVPYVYDRTLSPIILFKDERELDKRMKAVRKLSLEEVKEHSVRLIKEYNNPKIKTEQDLLNNVEEYEEETYGKIKVI